MLSSKFEQEKNICYLFEGIVWFLIKMAKFIKLIVLVFITSLVATSLADGPTQIQRRKQKPQNVKKRVQTNAPLPKKEHGYVWMFHSWSNEYINTNFYFRSEFKNEIASKNFYKFG